MLNVAPAWAVAGTLGNGTSPTCVDAQLTFTAPLMASAAACNGSFPPAIALFETGLSLSTPAQCWHYQWEFGIPTQVRRRRRRRARRGATPAHSHAPRLA